eukprot:CAMPEP_0197023652 /NCGR_PEP_ID=MMETSP1384-20130603/4320_1 /TAXON_ID=29189 /ORGANISM="Ammonia sp." /LENGTH=201 /DNA_ID=CAMNT_0042451897 /DNA_START=53 /DNA_END=658 /DNA_ORIENTATION=+
MAAAAVANKLLNRPTVQSSILLLCDIQAKFGQHLPNIERVVSSSKFLMNCSFVLDIPVIATEQYPKAFGKTREELATAKTMIFEKTKFSMLTDEVNAKLHQIGGLKQRNDVILTGIEGHICVLQTALDLLNMGYNVHLCVDAIDSQRSIDKEMAMQRLSQCGAVLTTSESVLFQLLGDAKHAKFKETQQFVKQHIDEISKL